MAGHSKWHNIQHRKGAQDAKRGKMFTKLIREITVAAKMGGADESANPRLRTAIDKALSANMTKDTIKRAVTRGAGGGDGTDMSEIRYEGYGIAGVAVIVDCLTDNKNRTVAEVRHAFTKMGGNLGTDGSVAYLFEQTGCIPLTPPVSEDSAMEVALEAGAEDIIKESDENLIVITSPDTFLDVKEALVSAGLNTNNAEITYIATTEVTLDKDQAENILKLTDMLEDLDDVQAVYTNANIPESILETL